jgi:rubrerythrin
MTILDDAITLEERARAYYEEARGRVSDQSAGKILGLLEAEEERHAAALKRMQKGDYAAIEASSLLKQVRGLVEGAVNAGSDSISTDASMRAILQKAMGMEQETEKFYRAQSEKADDTEARTLFSQLAEQEQGHYLMVSSLIEYFHRPDEWVESAEFGLRPEY